MEVIKGVPAMTAWSSRERAGGRRIGLVPTMGFLHEGHLSLVKYVQEKTDRVVVSIFVNPIQFGPREDLAKYPRDMNRDLALLDPLGVAVVFNPEPSEMYPSNFQTRVEVTQVSSGLCGQFRPGHFIGVATVVLKLFNIVKPHLAVFGEKDYQQLAVIKRMVKDLDVDVVVEGRPTMREKDGLAMSSRNVYLSPEERKSALALSQALTLAKEMVSSGVLEAEVIQKAVIRRIEAHPGAKVQYVALVDPLNLTPVERLDQPTLLALAVMVGGTRLIDNVIIESA